MYFLHIIIILEKLLCIFKKPNLNQIKLFFTRHQHYLTNYNSWNGLSIRVYTSDIMNSSQQSKKRPEKITFLNTSHQFTVQN